MSVIQKSALAIGAAGPDHHNWPFVQLLNGTIVDLLRPHSEQIHWPSIAESLAKLARFNGHTQGAP